MNTRKHTKILDEGDFQRPLSSLWVNGIRPQTQTTLDRHSSLRRSSHGPSLLFGAFRLRLSILFGDTPVSYVKNRRPPTLSCNQSLCLGS